VDFELSEDQVSLAELVRVILEGRFPIERIRRAEESRSVVDPDDWTALGEAGVFSLTVPEADGGVGLGLADAAVVFEELGRDLVPGPLVASHLAAGLVDGAADGSVVVGAVRAPGDLGPGAGGTGRAPLLLEHLDALGALVVVGPGDRLRVVEGDALSRLVASAVPVERSLDPLTPLSRVDALPEGRPVQRPHFERDFQLLTGALCVGLAAGACAAAVGYAKEREQFGRPIGSFQAVKHLCADMLVRAETTRAAVQAAAVTADDPEVGDADRLAAGAALLAAEAALANAKTSIQVHGGMGFTWEMSAHLFLMRARILASSLGPLDALAAVVADRY
jgi:alkylation response protein AidB-like acyl-CoA dehydrogenase